MKWKFIAYSYKTGRPSLIFKKYSRFGSRIFSKQDLQKQQQQVGPQHALGLRIFCIEGVDILCLFVAMWKEQDLRFRGSFFSTAYLDHFGFFKIFPFWKPHVFNTRPSTRTNTNGGHNMP